MQRAECYNFDHNVYFIYLYIIRHNLHFTANLYQNYISIEDEGRKVEYIRKFLGEECVEINSNNV